MNYYGLTPCTAPRRFELTDMNASSTQTQAISRNGSVPIMLETVVRTTGMRFAAIARVTDTSWTGCAVRDEIDFGTQSVGK
ncbi:MAG: hypothetical protein ABI767_12440 [Rhodanobacter sp.]